MKKSPEENAVAYRYRMLVFRQNPRLWFLPIILCLGSCTTRLADQSFGVDSQAGLPAGTYRLSAKNTRITFIGTAVANSHEGEFTRVDGIFVWHAGDLSTARLSVTIDMNSIFTKIDLLTKHLKDTDFFDSSAFPTAQFESARFEPAGDHYLITGNFTIHGVTQTITFPIAIRQTEKQIQVQSQFTIRQSAFNMQSARTTTDEVPVTVECRIGR